MSRSLSKVSREALEQRLQSSASALHVSLSPKAIEHLVCWLQLMVQWNQRLDLTAARTEAELLDLAVADAFALSPLIAEGLHVVDVGSGAGAPGLPLGLIRPDLKVTLVEPLAKRVAFLNTVLGTVESSIQAKRLRGEQLLPVTEPWQLAISRATLEPPAWLALGLELVGPQGQVAVMLARQPAPEHPGATFTQSLDYRWPQTQSERRVCLYQKP